MLRKLSPGELRTGMAVKTRKMSVLGQGAPLIDATVVHSDGELVAFEAYRGFIRFNVICTVAAGKVVDDSGIEIVCFGEA